MTDLFGLGPRTDRTVRRFDEGFYTFLNRTDDPYVDAIRSLMTRWFGHVPLAENADLRGRLQSKDDAQFEGAFWELYLHEAYRASGYSVTIHPRVRGTKRPDFLIEGEGTRFYLEAVRAGSTEEDSRAAKLYGVVRQALEAVRGEHSMVSMTVYSVGPKPLKVGALRGALQIWLEAGAQGELPWAWDGWRLGFDALPLPGRGGPLIGAEVRGGWANDAMRITMALDSKVNRYQLDGPLVIAVLSNTEIGTDDQDVERALFGAAIGRQSVTELPQLVTLTAPGFWRGEGHWKHSHVPQVIAAQDLSPWKAAKVRPRLWTTPEPGISPPRQPGWLTRMEVTSTGVRPGRAEPMYEVFDLPEDWPGPAPRLSRP
ncbi:hypothetical protein [Streptacidiphilus anmyonensis]|uniref:hypothetical protein n=1 Tax=Streptacidiphilus anmyonensis TaxID=405782 RepID=UPI00128BE439|nr:hypothetical protein [Streptacidiphilus anmyonensis]